MSTTAASLRPPNPRRPTDPILPVAATANDGDLPLDVLYEILLRLPPEPLFRFRAVYRSWRSLLCHPEFVAAARNPGPLLAIGVNIYSSTNEVHILDVQSGDAVKLNLAANDDAFLSPSYGETRAMSDDDRVACVVSPYGRIRLIDLANGAVSLLPDDARLMGDNITSVIAGHAAATGEHKVLAIANYERQVFKIFTLGLDNNVWRDTGSPPLRVRLGSFRYSERWGTREAVVVNGVAYVLSHYIVSIVFKDKCAHQIMTFDMGKEAWRPAASSLQGPANCHDICLAKLDGHLVAGHAHGDTAVQLWFLVDLGRSLWSMRYTISMPCCQNNGSLREYFEKPLAVLDDGRIVVWMRQNSGDRTWLRIYDPRTKTFRDGTRVPTCSRPSVFTWSLLHSEQRGALGMAAKRLFLARRHQRTGATSTIEGPYKKTGNR